MDLSKKLSANLKGFLNLGLHCTSAMMKFILNLSITISTLAIYTIILIKINYIAYINTANTEYANIVDAICVTVTIFYILTIYLVARTVFEKSNRIVAYVSDAIHGAGKNIIRQITKKRFDMKRIFAKDGLYANDIKYDPRLTKYIPDLYLYLVTAQIKIITSLYLTIICLCLYTIGYAKLVEVSIIMSTYSIPNLPQDYTVNYKGVTLILYATLPFAAYYLYKRMVKITDIGGSIFYKTLIKIMSYKKREV